MDNLASKLYQQTNKHACKRSTVEREDGESAVLPDWARFPAQSGNAVGGANREHTASDCDRPFKNNNTVKTRRDTFTIKALCKNP